MRKPLSVVSYEVPMGFPQTHRRMEAGYKLENGIVLLEAERDAKGNYKGGVGMDGMYLHTFTSYVPVKTDADKITAFAEVED